MAIWTINNENKFNSDLHKLCFETNLNCDQILLPYDLKILKAHSSMLLAGNYLSEEEHKKITSTLEKFNIEHKKGNFSMSSNDEDCHSFIEEKLIEFLGELGKKLYMARSRNDQIIQILHLYAIDKITTIEKKAQTLANSLLNFSKKYEKVVIPGYSHTQQAMPCSLGMWASSYLEILLQQKDLLKKAKEKNSIAVLGSAAGYGTNFKLDRTIIQKVLNLKSTQINNLSCQLSRGVVEIQTLQLLWGIMFVLNRFSNDLVWLTSYEFSLLKANEKCTTGSSIMPQKRNLDPCEIVRSKYHIFNGYINQISGIVSNLFFGYNSDFQETKKPFIEGLNTIDNSLEIINLVIPNIESKEINNNKFSPEIFATDLVNEKVKMGMSFRDAYQEVKESLKKKKAISQKPKVEKSTLLGSTGNLALEQLEKKLIHWKKSSH